MKHIVSYVLAAVISIGLVGNVFAISDNVLSTDSEVIKEALSEMTETEKTQYINENLDVKSRYISVLATLTSNRSYDRIADVVTEAISSGLTAVEIKEAVYHSAAYCGYTRAINAMEVVDETLKSLNVEIPANSRVTVTEATRYNDGLAVQRLLFGQQIGTITDDMTPAAKIQTVYLSGICFGDFYTRTGLNLAERELVTFSTIAANGGCSPQVTAHANANINVGNSKEMLRAAVLASEEFNGEAKTVESLAIVNALEDNPDAKAPDYPERTPVANESYTTDADELNAIMAHYDSDYADEYISGNLDADTQKIVKATAEAVAEGNDVPKSDNSKVQTLIHIAELAAEGDKSDELTDAVKTALTDDCSADELLAAILLCVPYNGFPRTLNATSAVNNVQAEMPSKVIKLTIGSPTITVNGEETAIDSEGTVPIIKDERTLLPVRAVVEAIGGSVAWDSETQTAILAYNDNVITLAADNATAYLNDEPHTLDVAPMIINDRTMLPIRFIAESFGCTVDWDGTAQTVTINLP